MNHKLHYFIVCCLLFISSQRTNAQQVPNETYYTYLDRYFSDSLNQGDYAEGGEMKHMQRQARMWGPRLYPHGSFEKAGKGMTDYVRNFLNSPSPAPMINSTVSDPQWRAIGPIGRNDYTNTEGIGRIHRLAFHPHYNLPRKGEQTIFAVSSFGGLWKSTDDGLNWINLNTDTQLPFTNVSDVVIDPKNPSRIYISTGLADERGGAGHNIAYTSNVSTNFFGANNAGDNALVCHGVYRSDDGGANWQNISIHTPQSSSLNLVETFEDGGTIRKMIIHPNNPDTIFLATSKGIIRTKNASSSITQVSWELVKEDDTPDKTREFRGLAFKPGNPGVVYASGKDIFRSDDDGDTWESMTGTGGVDPGLPALDFLDMPDINSKPHFQLMRINIAVTPGDENVLYAYLIGLDRQAVANWERVLFIYRYSPTDGWTKHYFRNDDKTNPFHRISPRRIPIAVSPTNPDEVYFGYTSIRWTTDINNDFPNFYPYSSPNLHADIHDLAFPPNTPDGATPLLFAATDGGVSKRVINAEEEYEWKARSGGLEVAKIWTFDDSERDTEVTLTGLQDIAVFRTEQGATPGTYDWHLVAGGDGYGAKIDDKTGKYGYLLANDDFRRIEFDPLMTDPGENNMRPFDDPNNTGSGDPRARINYTFPMQNHPQTGDMYFGFTEIYRRTVGVPTSTMTPSDLWDPVSEFRLEVSDLASIGARNLTEMEIAPSNPNYIYVARPGADNAINNIDGGGDFTTRKFKNHLFVVRPDYYDSPLFDNIVELTSNLVSAIGLSAPNGNGVTTDYIPVITGLAVDPKDHLRLWVSFSGYEEAAKVWMTENGGITWQNADPLGDLANLPVNAIEYVDGSNDCLIIGTDAGVYIKENATSSWHSFGTGFPHVRVMELKVNTCAGRVRVATYGRGLWEGDIEIPDFLSTETRIEGIVDWDEDRNLTGNLRIPSGSVLTLTSELNMPVNSRIWVERGGKLIVDGGKITNRCGQIWHGIEVWGNAGIAHPSLTAALAINQPPSHPDHGVLVIKNNGLIEHAKNAVSLIQRTPYSEVLANSGGIIIADGSTFRNNGRSVEFMKFRPSESGALSDDNLSKITNCTFIHTNETRISHAQIYSMISLWNVAGVSIKGNTFKNQDPHDFAPNHRGVGIYSIDAGYRVEGICYSSPCKKYKPNTFQDLNVGVYPTASYAMAGPVIIDRNEFINCITGSFAVGIQNNLQYTRNKHDFLASATATNIGTYFSGCTEFILSDNSYFSGRNGYDWAMVINNSGSVADEVYRNDMHSLSFGMFLNGDNSGLQIKCNEFDLITNQSIINAGQLPDQGFCDSGGIFEYTAPASNIVNDGPCNGPADHFQNIGSGSAFTYNHQLGIDYTPACYSPNITLQNCLTFYNQELSCPNKLDSGLEELNEINKKLKSVSGNSSNKDYLAREKSLASQRLIHQYLTQGKTADAQIYLENEAESTEKDMRLIPLMIREGNLERASTLLTQFPKETDAQQLFASLNMWMLNLKEDHRTYKEMTKAEEIQLRHIAQSATPYSANALAILHFVYGEEIPQEVATMQAFSTETETKETSLSDKINFQLYPNPVKNLLTLKHYVSNSTKKGLYVLLDVHGKQLRKRNLSLDSSEQTWDLSSLPSGIYVIELRIEGEVIQKEKLVIQH